ncbi:hypothetical protein [Streptomyces sp. NPDC002547]
MAEVELHIEQRALDAGRPVVLWPGKRALYAAYDPNQISEELAVQAIALVAPGGPTIKRVTRDGELAGRISVEDSAKHGRFR